MAKCEKLFCLLLVLACIVLGFCSDTGFAGQKEGLLPWIAWQQNLDRLETGQGKLTWKSTSAPKGETSKGQMSIVHSDFGFDGEKRRWDRTFEKWVIGDEDVKRKANVHVENGFRTYDYNKGGSYIYAHESGRRDDLRWNGEMVDYKWLMQPMNQTLTGFKKGMGLFGGIKMNLKKDPLTGKYALTLSADKEGKIVITFDPQKGYAPVKEEHYDGDSIQEINRDFNVTEDGIWYLSSMTQKSYNKSTETVFSEFEIKVQSFSANADIPKDYFLPRGFGAPTDKTVRVIDRVMGDLMYNLHVSEESMAIELDEAVADIKNALRDNNTESIDSAEIRPKSFAGGTEPMAPGKLSPVDNKKFFSSKTFLVAIILLATAASVYTLAFYHRKKCKAKKRAI